MNRFLILLLVAAITLGLVYIAKIPGLLNEIWLWLLGFAGIIIGFFQELAKRIRKLLTKDDSEEKTPREVKKAVASSPAVITLPENPREINLTILRISDDGETVVGKLFLNEVFYCYTLEDSHSDEKIRAEILPAPGAYSLRLNQNDQAVASVYQQLYPGWFSFPLQLQNVPGFTAVYILNNSNDAPDHASIMVTDTLQVSNKEAFLKSSEATFKRLYLWLRQALEKGISARIIIKEEDRIHQHLKAS